MKIGDDLQPLLSQLKVAETRPTNYSYLFNGYGYIHLVLGSSSKNPFDRAWVEFVGRLVVVLLICLELNMLVGW